MPPAQSEASGIYTQRPFGSRRTRLASPMTTNFGFVTCRSRVFRRLIIGVTLTAFTLGWLGASPSHLPPHSQRQEPTAGAGIDAVVDPILRRQSPGDPDAENK